MKKLFLMLFILSMPILLFAQQQDSEIGIILKGEHQLAEFSEDNYFIVIKNTDGLEVIFMWKDNTEGAFVTTAFPLNAVHVNFINTGESPFVKFRWEKGKATRMDVIVEKHIIYIQVNCTQEQWQSAFVNDSKRTFSPSSPSSNDVEWEFGDK